MSSHRMSVSGQRPYTLNAGGGPFSGFTVPSRREDGFQFTASNFRRIEIPVHGNVRLEKRKVPMRATAGEQKFHEINVLVIENEILEGSPEGSVPAGAGIDVYGFPVGDDQQVGGENTNLDVRRPGERFGPTAYYDSEEVVASERLLPDAPVMSSTGVWRGP